eukprot:2286717-Alexandrium_andersonii.AAC.1
MVRAACSASEWRFSSQLLRALRSCSQAATAVGGRSGWRMDGIACSDAPAARPCWGPLCASSREV